MCDPQRQTCRSAGCWAKKRKKRGKRKELLHIMNQHMWSLFHHHHHDVQSPSLVCEVKERVSAHSSMHKSGERERETGGESAVSAGGWYDRQVLSLLSSFARK